jgi:uncharacterized membrane protein YidH (DUF202 family)
MERTLMAWSRTALGLAAVSVLALRFPDGSASALLAAGGLVCAPSLVLASRRRGRPRPALSLVACAAASVVALAASCTVLLLLERVR